jgi:prophage regulatory protein
MIFTPDDASFRVGGNMRVLAYGDLKAKGIRFSRQWIVKLVALGKFPAPIKLGEQSVAFVEAEIDEWLEARIRERDKKLVSNAGITSETEPLSPGNVEASGATLEWKTGPPGSRIRGRTTGHRKVQRGLTP